MTRKTQRVSVERIKSADYKKVAQNFYKGAELAGEYEYWNVCGVLIVHAAIAFGDAVTIKYGGVKSKGENHHSLVQLLDELITPSAEKKNALAHLSKIIDHKNAVSYSGDVYEEKDIRQLWKNFDRFRLWAEKLLNA
jgi:hypothetical protein